MKRPLDDQEIELTKKGMENVTAQIEDIKEQIEFNEETIAFQTAQNEYQDKVRPYLRKKKAEEDEKVMGALKETLARNTDTLKNLQEQINKGIEVKKIKQVKREGE